MKQYLERIFSPLGPLLVSCSEDAVTGLWFIDHRYPPPVLPERRLALHDQVQDWLMAYFHGEMPELSIPLCPAGTPFQQAVWRALSEIPYGQTQSYGALAEALGGVFGHPTSPRAVGTAVGRNPISILIPCHRVIGADGSLTGYAGGLERKQFLLALEQK